MKLATEATKIVFTALLACEIASMHLDAHPVKKSTMVILPSFEKNSLYNIAELR
ncbi:MAG: hypothetical protein QM791_04015 [Ferruginibacter sp.]